MSELVTRLTRSRASDPDAIASSLAKRTRGLLTFPRKVFLIAADHPARGVMAAGGDATRRVHLRYQNPDGKMAQVFGDAIKIFNAKPLAKA